MHEGHNSRDWEKLCAITTELFPQFGTRRRAFAEAKRQNPHLNATPPGVQDALKLPHSRRPATLPDAGTVSGARPWKEIIAVIEREGAYVKG